MIKNYFPKVLIFLLFFFSTLPYSIGQEIDEDYKRFRISELKEIHSGIDLSPMNNDIVAISGNKSAPVYLYDWKNDKVKDQFNVENWYAGSAIEYSSQGNYLVLNQLFYADWAVNRDKKVLFQVLDKDGNKVLRLEDSNEAKVSPDEKKVLSLSHDKITEYDLVSGKAVNSHTFPEKGFAFDLSPDGKYLVMAHAPVEDRLKKDPRYKKDKKALKSALKFKHRVSVYTYPDFQYVGSVSELYDLIYELKFSDDGSQLFCLQIPHMKAQSGTTGSQIYVNVINTEGWQPIRKGFVSKAAYQPDFKLSSNGQYFGIVSKGIRFPELHIYNYETMKMLDRFEFTFRVIESDEHGIIAADTRPSFVFLPDNERILIAFGNRLYLWNFKSQ